MRRNEGGELYAAGYGLCAALNWDPVEKKPLYHFYPGSSVLSLGTYGCNLSCSFCQNWTLARGDIYRPATVVSPDDILDMLQQKGGPDRIPAVAYTYNEPTVWFEFVFDTASLLSNHGYKNILVTNGYINEKPLKSILPYIDAMNIDVKAYNDGFYRRYCCGTLKPVLNTVEMAIESCHVEITTLLIPTLNDNLVEIENLCRWLGGLDPEIPLHFSRYFPQYEMEIPPTPPHVLRQAKETALKYLHYVYLGNVDLPGCSDTVCPNCGNLLVARNGYRISSAGLEGDRCRKCSYQIKVVT